MEKQIYNRCDCRMYIMSVVVGGCSWVGGVLDVVKRVVIVIIVL